MIRKIASVFIIIFFILGVFASSYLLIFTQQGIAFGQEKVVYNLPYPGILPDHPLYIFKAVRDRLMDILTRDYIKKANLYLLFSDKRINMAVYLTKKGKNKLAIETFAKGEKYFLKIPDLLVNSKKQGVGAPTEFIGTLKLANAKHEELAVELLKTAPQDQLPLVEAIIKINKDIKQRLQGL